MCMLINSTRILHLQMEKLGVGFEEVAFFEQSE